MLCAFHAAMEEQHQIRTAYLTERMADGPMSFTFERTGKTVAEAA